MNDTLDETNSIFKNILEKLESSIEIICEGQREKHIQDILAAQLKCLPRKTLSSPDFPDVEIDLIGDDFALEIKYNEKYYSGFCQILSQRILYSLKNVYLIHIHEYLNSKFVNAFFKLAEELKIHSVLINKRTKEILVKS